MQDTTSTRRSNRFLVVHGHFYQPPRENPWIESVETQDTAAPYHDWNDRITAECYARNGASRIVNTANQILRIVNNYAQISFNFGPTLLSWLEEQAPLTYDSILEADRASRERFSGHGSAMAQVYNHIIMPLASRRDKELQVRWGIADFEHRFGRKPEGMWLAETAVDTETLEVLAAEGIRFTVLAPNQCAASWPAEQRGMPPVVDVSLPSTGKQQDGHTGSREQVWHATPEGSVDSRRAYRVSLSSGRSIAVFFYDGPRSRAIAFERLLDSGEGFALRMAGGFSSDAPAEPELVHVATDGESYGHHHRYGEMALSYALQYTEAEQLATVTNYGEFLERFPPAWEARIAEDTSWSCAHGVERWRSDCGCNGGKAGFNQRWRAPLRAALDAVRDAVVPLAAASGTQLFRDWHGACDRYIAVLLDRARANEFLQAELASRAATQAATQRKGSEAFNLDSGPDPVLEDRAETREVRALKLLELVRNMQLMYTSCGWFFDDISGIETVQIIAYAARALELAAALFGTEGQGLEARFLATLREAHSNVAGEGSGADIYARHVKCLQVGLEQVAAHYAISSVFKTYPDRARVFAFEVVNLGQEVQNSGRGRLIAGEASIRSTLTHEQEDVFYAVLHFGDQNIASGVRGVGDGSGQAHKAFAHAARAAMLGADLPAVIRLFDREFGGQSYTIRSLFTDEQRRVMKLILNNTVQEAEESLIRLYADHASLLHFLSQADVPRPSALALAANFAINVTLRRALESDPVDQAQVRASLALAAQDHVELDKQELSFTADRRMSEAMSLFAAQPGSSALLDNALSVAETLQLLPFPANIWQAQNIWHELAVAQRGKAPLPVADAVRFEALGCALQISVAYVEADTASRQLEMK